MRKSNFEALRIFAMFGIVLHHLMVNDLDVLGYNKPYLVSEGGGISNTQLYSSMWRRFVFIDNRLVRC